MLREIARQIKINENDKNKVVCFHYQVLINADKLCKINPEEFCKAVNMNVSYVTEFKKMIKLAQFIKLSKGSIVINQQQN